ncbi:MAG TPA: sugar isomerase [Clostridiales bacterium]|nr:sugar isomerase [Clostridiales bacterium]
MNVSEIVADIRAKSEARGEPVESVYFIACGGSLAGIYAGKYLLERESVKLRVADYNAKQFVLTTPRAFNKNCIAVCCTLKGTPEVEEAIKLCNEVGAYTILICGDGNEDITEYADYIIRFKTVADVNTPMMETNISESLLLSFEILHQFEYYKFYEDAIQAFGFLENMAAKIRRYVNKGRAQEFAEMNKEEEVIYVMAGAPALGVGYAFSLCSLMEIQWIHSPFVNSAEYFHGSFETLDKNLSVLQLISDGRSREEDLRAESFLKRFGKKISILDAKELCIDEIKDTVKEYFNHVILDVALREYITQLAIVRKHPKEVRRYMWKMEY